MGNHFDVIVIGVGSMGAATCYHLAKRYPGKRILGLEQFDIPHGQGSHHGHSRMIRLAYFEHPDYVTLLRRAYENWDAIESECKQQLLHVTGGLYLGRPDSELVTGSMEAAKRYDLPHEVLSRSEVAKRYPQFNVADDSIAFFENQAGLLIPEKVVAAYAEQAMRRGVELHGREEVKSWKASHGRVVVQTGRATYEADHVILCAGAWTESVLASHLRSKGINPPLQVTRQTMGWFWPRSPDLFSCERFPCWALDLAPKDQFGGVYYGFPMMPENPGFKIALHWPNEPCEPGTIDRSCRPKDEAELRHAIEQYFPEADGPLLSMRTCLYTNSPDGHFIVDRHPQHERVTIGCGFSGHGFKFVSVMGEVLAELAMEGRSKQPVEFLGLDRFKTTESVERVE